MFKLRTVAAVVTLLVACGDESLIDQTEDAAQDDAADTATDSTEDARTDGTGSADIDAAHDSSPDGQQDAGADTDDDATPDTEDAEDAADTADAAPDGGPVCGNGLREPGEFCDGADLGGATCASAGLGAGELACRGDCSGFEIAGCGGDCTPACEGRECGVDPICGVGCGTCGGAATCTTAGICEPIVACGDGVREATEVCDGADLGGDTCVSLGYTGGSLGCATDCAAFSEFACTGGDPGAICGNGDQEPGELCDLADVGGRSCADFGFDRGLVVCDPDCGSFNLSGCSDEPTAVCGNSVRESGEVCDRADLGGQSCVGLGYSAGALACAADCGSYNTGACTSACSPSCGSRECGADPTCGISCGTCDAEETCNPSGVCEARPPSPPVIITLNVNSLEITEGESIVFSAVVTDPDGIDDLIGGTMFDAATGLSYGAFATSAAEGAYSITLSWADLHRVTAIDFVTATPRTFRAAFFDTSGSRTTRDITVTLTCDGRGACDSVCTDLQSSASNCGACGQVCAGGGLVCNAGTCECPGELDGICRGWCTDLDTSFDCGTCGNSCGALDCLPDRTCGCEPGFAACSSGCSNRLNFQTCGPTCVACAINEFCDGYSCQSSASDGTVRLWPQGLSEIPVLQVWVSGGFRNVCDDGFGTEEAVVACRSLGGELVSFETGIFESDFDYEVGDYACSGSEATLASCANSGLNNPAMVSRCGDFGDSVTLVCSFGEASCTPPSGLRINEIFFDPPGDDGASNAEFIELNGPAGTSLSGVSLVGYDSAGNEYGRWEFEGATVPADGFFVVGPSFNARNSDWIAGGLMQNGPGSIQLRSSCRDTLMDAIAYGTFGVGQAPRGEGTPEGAPSHETSLGRDGDSSDSNNNATDFYAQLLPTPGQQNFDSSAWAPVSLDGDFGGGDRTYARTSATCASTVAGSYLYDVYEIRNPSGAARTINVEATWLDADGYLAVYNGDSFNPANPTTGCIAVNDDAAGVETARSYVSGITVPGNGTITVVLTGYDEMDYGAYTLNLLP